VKELREEFQLLTKSPEKFEEPVKRAEELLNELLGSTDVGNKKLQEFDELLRLNQDDEVLFTKVFPRIPKVLVERYHQILKHRFFERLRKFDQHVSGSLPFSYTDVVADFYEEVYRIVDDLEIKRLILSRLLDMGHAHNRFHVGEVFATIVKSVTSHEEALLVREVLKQNPQATVWCADGCRKGSLVPLIKDTIDQCVKVCAKEP
jgi:hypothetical protein